MNVRAFLDTFLQAPLRLRFNMHKEQRQPVDSCTRSGKQSFSASRLVRNFALGRLFLCREEHIEYLLDADGLSRVEYRPAPVFLKEDRDHDNLYKGGFNRREGAENTLSLRPLRLLRARCGSSFKLGLPYDSEKTHQESCIPLGCPTRMIILKICLPLRWAR